MIGTSAVWQLGEDSLWGEAGDVLSGGRTWLRPGGAGQVDAVWMAESDSVGDGRTVEELRPGVEDRAGAEIVENETEGEMGRDRGRSGHEDQVVCRVISIPGTEWTVCP